MQTNPNFFTPIEIVEISKEVSVLDYFQYLELKKKVVFDKKIGNEFYFKTYYNKFSVSDNGYFDFKSDEGGQIIKAVMEFEKLDWKDAIEFLKNFNGQSKVSINNLKEAQMNLDNLDVKSSKAEITNIFPPNNEKLISYFEERGISKQVLVDNTKQIHYQI